MTETTAHSRREFRGYPSSPSTEEGHDSTVAPHKPPFTTESAHHRTITQSSSHTHKSPLTTRPVHHRTTTRPPYHTQSHHLPPTRYGKRQPPPGALGPASNGSAFNLLTQLNTALYAIDLINLNSNLTTICHELRDNSTIEQAALIAINITQAATIICTADATGLHYVQPSLVQVFAAALYAVDLASNFTGTTNTTALCNNVDLNIVSLPAFGVDGAAVQGFVCNATASSTTASTTVTSSYSSAGTITPLATSNSTLIGTGIKSISTSATAMTGTGLSSYGNSSTSKENPGTGISIPTIGNFTLPTGTLGTGTGSPLITNSSLPTGTWGAGAVNMSITTISLPPSASAPPMPSNGNFTLPPWTSGNGTAPSGNFTIRPWATSIVYAQPSGTGVSGDPVSTEFSPLSTSGDPTSDHLPPRPSTPHYYPAFTTSTTSANQYGYGYGG